MSKHDGERIRRAKKTSIKIVLRRFDVHLKCFFSPAIRSRIVQFILDRKRFSLGTEDDYAFGIDRLITEEAYIAAYPLHDVRKCSLSHYIRKHELNHSIIV